MDKQFILTIANTIREQLLGITPANIFCCWGVSSMFATEHNKMAALGLNVNGRLHTGKVLIAYNEGTDYYEIYLQNGSDIKQAATDIDFTQLGDTIDRLIESGDDPEEYAKFCMEEKRKLMCGMI